MMIFAKLHSQGSHTQSESKEKKREEAIRLKRRRKNYNLIRDVAPLAIANAIVKSIMCEGLVDDREYQRSVVL